MSLPKAAAPSKQDVLTEIRVAMEKEFGLSAEEIQPHTHLIDDLDLDSIDLIDLAVTIEESTGIRLEEEELEMVRTVQDAVDIIHAGLSNRVAGPE